MHPVSTGYPKSYTLIKVLNNRGRQDAQATKFFAVGPNKSLYGSLVWTLIRVSFPAPGFLEGLLGFFLGGGEFGGPQR